MQKFYTLSNTAGLIRSNKFNDKADAVCVGTYRAEMLNLPVKVFEHDESKEMTCVLVCMPDGSAAPPQGEGYKTAELGNSSSGSTNESQAYVLLSAYDEKPITTFYLKSAVSEALASQMEKEFDVEIGLYDEQTLHAYTEDSGKIRKIESKLAESSIEISRLKDSVVRREKVQAATELVEAARKAHKMARASQMPEMSVRASSRFGSALRMNCHCEVIPGNDKKSPVVAVYADGQRLGEAKDARGAARLMSEHATREFSKYLKKEMA